METEKEDAITNNELSEFLESGIYRFGNSEAVFIDPVRVINRSYSRFRVSPSAYYSRSFRSSIKDADQQLLDSSNPRKRKRKQKKVPILNERELAAELRHQVPSLLSDDSMK